MDPISARLVNGSQPELLIRPRWNVYPKDMPASRNQRPAHKVCEAWSKESKVVQNAGVFSTLLAPKDRRKHGRTTCELSAGGRTAREPICGFAHSAFGAMDLRNGGYCV